MQEASNARVHIHTMQVCYHCTYLDRELWTAIVHRQPPGEGEEDKRRLKSKSGERKKERGRRKERGRESEKERETRRGGRYETAADASASRVDALLQF
jgi:hypothetical protein